MRTVACDFCGKEEKLKLEGSSSIQRLFFSDICFDCYQIIIERFTEGGDVD